MKKRNKFSLSHHKILSCRMGQLIPIGLTEVLPGDTVQHATTGLVRCAPLVSPVMARADVRIHHWFVPMRLIWNSWESFITGGADGNDSHVVPYFNVVEGNPVGRGSLADYLGVPVGSYGFRMSQLPFRAYQLIYNEFYRDEDLQDEAHWYIGDNVATWTTNNQNVVYKVRNICWEKDYFTSARPWTQKGDAVTIPVDADPNISASIVADGQLEVNLEDGTVGGPVHTGSGFPSSNPHSLVTQDSSGLYLNSLSYASGLKAQFTGDATLGSINVDDLRLALSLQRFKEARARFGSRYVEYLRYLGVISSDARLQRPEYLGGGRSPLQFSEVLQTAEGADPVGTMRGHGITALRSNRYRRFFEEHGYVMSLMSVRPKTVYTNMLPRTFIRQTKEDFFQPELEHIGQQEVYNKELNANASNPDGVFGYQDRYNEYRYHESSVAGEFRDTLNYWHMARDISGDFALNGSFVQCTPTDRIFAAPGTSEAPNDTLYCFFNHSIQARRLMSKMATPRIF